jgi:hypothetical protein
LLLMAKQSSNVDHRFYGGRLLWARLMLFFKVCPDRERTGPPVVQPTARLTRLSIIKSLRDTPFCHWSHSWHSISPSKKEHPTFWFIFLFFKSTGMDVATLIRPCFDR